jgi:hypothetical protein
MTKKHFEEMARMIRERKNKNDSPEAIHAMIQMAIHMGRMFNARFDADRFRAACQAELQEL